MKRTLLLVCGLAAICAAQASKPLIIHDVTVIDATGAPAKPHQTLIVRDGKIEAIAGFGMGFAGKLPGTHVDGSGKFLIPGL